MTYKLRINTARQIAELCEPDQLAENETVLRIYQVSTAANGLGCREGSFCTPSGKLRVAQKLGEDLPIGAVLRGRVPTGEVWSLEASNPLATSQEDLILTRVLWLEGVEGENSNTLQRFIYLHGTNHESLLGQSVSHGCIRFSNHDIVEVFEMLPVGAEVEVK